jgi:hypothetical protein
MVDNIGLIDRIQGVNIALELGFVFVFNEFFRKVFDVQLSSSFRFALLW